ncbi:MAG: nitrile hydratase accessory protein [Oleispira sp.]|jgi:nitrile hydratase accessory protein
MISLATGLNAAIAGQSIDNITFQHPWTARAFALTLAASRAGHFSLKTFQTSLISAIATREASGAEITSEEDYYTCWLEALTYLLESQQIVTDSQLETAEDKVRVRLQALLHEHEHDHDHTHELPEPLYREGGKCK